MSSIETSSLHNYINLLPSEVLAHIFIRLQDLDEDKVPKEILTTPVYTLGLVSKTWLSVVFLTPQLWTSISFNIPGSSAPRLEGGILRSEHAAGGVTAPGDRIWRSNIRSLIEFLQRWLNQSGNLPLNISAVYPTFVDGLMLYHPDISFQSTLVSSTTRPLRRHPIIGYLNRYSHRWHTLRLRNFPVELLDQFKSAENLASSNDRPDLQELSISNVYGFQDSTQSSSGAAFDPWDVKACPRRLQLESILSTSFIHVCYARLTILELHLINQEDFFKIIQQAVEVEVCLLSEIMIDDMRPLFEGVILLKNLQKFLLTSLDDSPTIILGKFIMPSLEELGVRLDQDPDATDAIVDLLSRSRCSLRELRLSFASPAVLDLVCVLEHTPALQSLVITGLPKSLRFEEMNFLGNMMSEFFQTYIASGSGSGTLEPPALGKTSNIQAGAKDKAQTGATQQSLPSLNRFEYDGLFLFPHGMLDTFRDTFNSRGAPSPSSIQAGSSLSQGQKFMTYGATKISITLERGKPSQWNLNAS